MHAGLILAGVFAAIFVFIWTWIQFLPVPIPDVDSYHYGLQGVSQLIDRPTFRAHCSRKKAFCALLFVPSSLNCDFSCRLDMIEAVAGAKEVLREEVRTSTVQSAHMGKNPT